MENKVQFGLSDVHIGLYTVSETGEMTLGKPDKLPGAVSLSMDPETMELEFYADNVKYYAQKSDNGFTGTLEVARFPSSIKTKYMGYAETEDGGVANLKGVQKPSVYIVFEAQGDAQKSRGMLLNVSMGPIKHEHKTTEDKVDVETDSVDITVVGDNKTGLVLVEYSQDSAGYATLCTAPTAPKLKTTASGTGSSETH